MSGTTLCKQYGEYCASAGIHLGGGYDEISDTTARALTDFVDGTLNSLAKINSKFAQTLNELSKQGVDTTTKKIASLGQELSKITTKTMNTIRGGQTMAEAAASYMMGGILSESGFAESFYGGSDVPPIINHGNYMVDHYDFVTGAGEEITNSLKLNVAAFKSYLKILADMAKNGQHLKDKDELRRSIREQYEFLRKAADEFDKIAVRLGKSSETTKKLEELASSGKLKEIKEMLKEEHVNKEFIDNYTSLLRLQGSVAVRADELTHALKTIGMTMSEFHKLGNMREIDEELAKYEAKIRSKSGKDQFKYLDAIKQIRDMAYSQSNGEKFEGAGCGCVVDEPVDMGDVGEFDGGKCDKYTAVVNYFGGEFLSLEREVDYELAASNELGVYDTSKRNFMLEQAKIISGMMEAAQKAAMEFASKNNSGDDNVILFLRRLESLKLIDQQTLLDNFVTHGKNYNSKYIKDEIVSELHDLAAYAKKLVPVVGSSMGKFADSIEDYVKFLEKWYNQSGKQGEKMVGGNINCSGIDATSVYDRFEFVGGYMELNITNIVDVFKKSILLGRMQNGLNLGLEDMKSYSIEQDKMNAKVLADEVNSMSVSATEMISKYGVGDDYSCFPISKTVFETVLRNNIAGQTHLLHAAQAMEKKIRSYTEEIIHNPAAATEIADLLAKVSVDINWIADPNFEDLKAFCNYFHIEAIAKNGSKYGDDDFRLRYSTAVPPVVGAPVDLANQINPAGNDYIKQDKLSPFPIRIQDCISTYTSTLVAATKNGKFEPENDLKDMRDGSTGKTTVNHYDGRSILPSKTFEVANYGVNAQTTITSPTGTVKDIKFLPEAKIMRNYNEAISHLREAADRVLNLRNLFSVFDHIDDIYKKSKGVDDGVKIGQIYGAVKEYLILTSIYPIVYRDETSDKYICGFLAMRHFGHDVVVPFEDKSFQFRLPAGDLMTDLGVLGSTLKEFYQGVDAKHDNVDVKPFPSTEDYDQLSGNYVWRKDLTYQKAFEHKFKSRYARGDLIFTMIVKSMFAKIMSVLAMYNIINFNGRSNPTDGSENLAFAKLRNIYGGDSVMDEGFYSLTPEVKPECTELYMRLYYYILFYKQLFLEEKPGRIIEQVAALKRFALLPVQGSKFTAILKIFFLKNFDKVTDTDIKISDPDLIAYINECNKLWSSESGNDKVKFDKIIKEFINDINRRYGLVKTDNFKSVMNNVQKKTYPDLERMKSREDYHNRNIPSHNRQYAKPELLDGEDSPIGNLGAPSAKQEHVLNTLTKATTLIKPQKDSYKVEELLAAVYAFRTKLDRLTTQLSTDFESIDSNMGKNPLLNFSNSLNGRIAMVKAKLSLRSSNLDRFRIFKEQIMTTDDNKLHNIAPEIMLYRELVVNNVNLLYKIYTRLIANVRLYGTYINATDPLLRGTFLYYLDSVNTNLVTVNRLGKSPVLDFSTLQNVMDAHLSQTRNLHMMFRSSIDPGYADTMDKTITTLVNIHRSIFKDNGLVSELNDTKNEVKIYPTNDYSEYPHMTQVSVTDVENTFVFDEMATRWPDPVVLKDPRINILRGKAFTAPDLEFELLSENFSPKNIYVMFEYLLALMYKIFYERHGVWYGPLLDSFVDATSHISFNFDITTDTTSELGGPERFEGDLPFSNKMIALYKTIYAFATPRGDKPLVQNDITLIPEAFKSDMKKYIPLFLFLFKFIIKQAYLHAGMLADDAVVKSTDGVYDGSDPYDAGHLHEITGGSPAEIRELQNNIDDYIESFTSLRNKSLKLKDLSNKIIGENTKFTMGASLNDSPLSESDINTLDNIINILNEIKNSNDFSKVQISFAKLKLLYSRKGITTLGLNKFENTDMLKSMLKSYPKVDMPSDIYGAITKPTDILPANHNLIKTKEYYFADANDDEKAVNLMAVVYGLVSSDEEDIDKALNVVRRYKLYKSDVDAHSAGSEISQLRNSKLYKEAIKARDDLVNGLLALNKFYDENRLFIEAVKGLGAVPGAHGYSADADDNMHLNPHKDAIRNAFKLKENFDRVEFNNKIRTSIPKVGITPSKNLYNRVIPDFTDANLNDLLNLDRNDFTSGNALEFNAFIRDIKVIFDGADVNSYFQKINTRITAVDTALGGIAPKKLKDLPLYYNDVDFSKLVKLCKEKARSILPECKGYKATPDLQSLLNNLDPAKRKSLSDFQIRFNADYLSDGSFIRNSNEREFLLGRNEIYDYHIKEIKNYMDSISAISKDYGDSSVALPIYEAFLKPYKKTSEILRKIDRSNIETKIDLIGSLFENAAEVATRYRMFLGTDFDITYMGLVNSIAAVYSNDPVADVRGLTLSDKEKPIFNKAGGTYDPANKPNNIGAGGAPNDGQRAIINKYLASIKHYINVNKFLKDYTKSDTVSKLAELKLRFQREYPLLINGVLDYIEKLKIKSKYLELANEIGIYFHEAINLLHSNSLAMSTMLTADPDDRKEFDGTHTVNSYHGLGDIECGYIDASDLNAKGQLLPNHANHARYGLRDHYIMWRVGFLPSRPKNTAVAIKVPKMNITTGFGGKIVSKPALNQILLFMLLCMKNDNKPKVKGNHITDDIANSIDETLLEKVGLSKDIMSGIINRAFDYLNIADGAGTVNSINDGLIIKPDRGHTINKKEIKNAVQFIHNDFTYASRKGNMQLPANNTIYTIDNFKILVQNVLHGFGNDLLNRFIDGNKNILGGFDNFYKFATEYVNTSKLLVLNGVFSANKEVGVVDLKYENKKIEKLVKDIEDVIASTGGYSNYIIPGVAGQPGDSKWDSTVWNNAATFTGGSAESNLLDEIINVVEEYSEKTKSDMEKKLKKYFNKLVNIESQHTGESAKALAEAYSAINMALINLSEKSVKTLIDTLTRISQSGRFIEKAKPVIEYKTEYFPVKDILYGVALGDKYNLSMGNTNLFGSGVNYISIVNLGMATTENIKFFKSNRASEKLEFLNDSRSRYRELVYSSDNSFAKLNVILQSFILNDNVNLLRGGESAVSFGISQDDLLDLIHIMLDISKNNKQTQMETLLNNIANHNKGNDFGKFVGSLYGSKPGRFSGGMYDSDTYISYLDFCNKFNFPLNFITKKSFARAASIYQYINNSNLIQDEDEIIALIAHYLYSYSKTASKDLVIDIVNELKNSSNKMRNYFNTVSDRFTKSTKPTPKLTDRRKGILDVFDSTGSDKNNADYKFLRKKMKFDQILDKDGKHTKIDKAKPYCEEFGTVIDNNSMIARAKNAVKYATLIYKSLHKVFSGIGTKPAYLNPAPYISDVYEIVGKEKVITPISVGVDLIPTFANTVLKDKVTGGNIYNFDESRDRIPLGLHCNNIRDIYGLFTGGKSIMMENTMIFLYDDKLHSITIEDFPYLKSLVDKTELSEIARPGLTLNSISSYISNFGKLTKYLYELEFKDMFANTFPVFNSLSIPKYYMHVEPRVSMGGNEFGYAIEWQKGFVSSLCILLYTGDDNLLQKSKDNGSMEIMALNARDIDTSGAASRVTGHTVGNYKMINNDDLSTMLELNTNNREMLDYITRGGNIKKYTPTTASSITIDRLITNNIMDIGIMPINIHSMMREIPLASLTNGVYSFDIIIDWLIHDNDKMKGTGKNAAAIVDDNRILAPVNLDTPEIMYSVTKHYKNPLNKRVIPIPSNNTNIQLGLGFGNNGSVISSRPKVTHKHTDAAPSGDITNVLAVDIVNDANYTILRLTDLQIQRSLIAGFAEHYGKYYRYEKQDTIVVNTPVSYNHFRTFETTISGDSKKGYCSNKLIDPDLGFYIDKNEYSLINGLTGVPPIDGLVAAGGGGLIAAKDQPLNNDGDVDAVPKFKETYYYNQTTHEITAKDIYHGVDPDLRTPILGANIYSELLLNLFQKEFRARYEKSRSLARNQNTVVRGVSTLYQK